MSEDTQLSSFFDGVTGYASELLSIEAEGYLHGRREAAGLPYPTAADQTATRTDNDGKNLLNAEAAANNQSQQWLMIGGAVLVVLAFLVLLFGGKK